jgi:hypothetical protein
MSNGASLINHSISQENDSYSVGLTCVSSFYRRIRFSKVGSLVPEDAESFQ